MSKYRNNLPQLNGKKFLTDGGLETTLIFQHGIDLPHFACFPMLNEPLKRQVLREYYEDYIRIAKRNNMGFILESPTFRSNADWGYKLGYDQADLREVNQMAIHQLAKMREEYEDDQAPIVISGCIGPRGDGYVVSEIMDVSEAKHYHRDQIQAFKDAGADMITCYTMNYMNEALGIAEAAKEMDIPAAIGITVETDGNLPSGESLKEVITAIDDITHKYPSYYMINCAHPSHFASRLNGGKWKERIMAVRANASCKSHAELDESENLDPGDKKELANGYKELNRLLPNLKVIGGCCGTDHTHIEEICQHF